MMASRLLRPTGRTAPLGLRACTAVPRAAPHARRLLSSSSDELPSYADVVVVGGGSIGTSTLLHLQERGLNAILLERHQLTAGTTWHSAGMLWSLRPADVDIEMLNYTKTLIKKLEVETETDIWTENGGLFIASSPERVAEYQRMAELGKYYGVESHMLSPAETKEIHPLLNVDDVLASMYSPTDGMIDPTSVVNAYAKAAKKIGAKIYEGQTVASVETENVGSAKKIKAVLTESGARIETPMVINACGAWANELANMVDVQLPLLAMKHAFVVTESIPGMHAGLPNVRDHDLSIYMKTQGDSLALGGYEQNPEFWNDIDKQFSFGLFNLDWETFGQNLEGQLQRCPAVEDAGIKSTVCGPESFTPDHKPLVGPQPGVRGMFNACGFNSMGMMMGGGIGDQIATWITEGSPSLDLFSVDCSRFHPATVKDHAWTSSRTHESYAKTYAIVFPHDEALAGRGARRSALHQSLEQRGCVHQSRHGFERPGWFVPADAGGDTQTPKPYDFYGAYDDGGGWRVHPDHEGTTKHESHRYNEIIEGELTFGWPASHDIVKDEANAARDGVGLFDQSYFGKLYLSGEDAPKAIEWLCAADVNAKDDYSVTYTPLCNAKGGVEADLTVTKLPGGVYYFATGGATQTKDKEWILRTLEEKGLSKVSMHDASEEMTILSIQGPHSRRLLQPLVDIEMNNENFPFSTAKFVDICGHKVMCLRLTFVGELGYELHMPASAAVEIYEAIKTAGGEYEVLNNVPIRDAGYRAIDCLSAEKGYRHWHADLSNRDNPMEAGIGFTVVPRLKNPESSDFLGKHALEEARDLGLQRRLVCLTLDDHRPLHGGETIWRDGNCVGYVRSTAFGHSVNSTIAYGYVDKGADIDKITNKWLQAGTWAVGDRAEILGAKLHIKSPYDPSNERIAAKDEPVGTLADVAVELESQVATETVKHTVAA